MKVITKSDSAQLRWKARVTRAHESLARLLQLVEDEEFEWAPDDGIASIRHHLWEITESERRLASRLVRGTAAKGRTSCGAAGVSAAEMVRNLAASHRQLVNWLETADENDVMVGDAAGGGSTIDDLLFEHLQRTARHAASIELLVSLIDPARTVGSRA